jgi:diguanylate cyclase (GGDEF)-like protein
MVRESSREIDFVCRYGGEELSVILPQTDTDQAFILAERIRNKIQDTYFNFEGKSFQITISIGVASFPKDAQNSRELIMKADQCLYSAKSQGKNKTVRT